MPLTKVRPWRLVMLFGCVFVLTAYLPHPNLGDSLPQSVHNWLHGDRESPPES